MIGILAYGSLIAHPGREIESVLDHIILDVWTPFPVEYARRSRSRAKAPTLVPVPEDGCSTPVKSAVLVLCDDVVPQTAMDFLYRRELHKEGVDSVKYDQTKPKNANSLIISYFENVYGLSVVYYTNLAPNFTEILDPALSQEDKAGCLARAALDSLTQETFMKGLDGIQYLADNIAAGIITSLTEAYHQAVLRLTDGAFDLEDVRLRLARKKEWFT